MTTEDKGIATDSVGMLFMSRWQMECDVSLRLADENRKLRAELDHCRKQLQELNDSYSELQEELARVGDHVLSSGKSTVETETDGV